MINTAVIPAAGLGTRLLTATKEMPKEMVPIFCREGNQIITRPLIELIFLQMFDAGIRNFYIVVGRKKRAIEDHFTPDLDYLKLSSNNRTFRKIIKEFYDKVEKSNIIWINQNNPKGFGAAVLAAKDVVGNRPFIVQAGDAFIRGNSSHLKILMNSYEKTKSDIMLYIRKILNPKAYGVAEAQKINNYYKIFKVVEKPKYPKSNFALMPLYIFNSEIFDSLSKIKPGLRNELQLTDGIQKVIALNGNVNAIKFQNADDCIDIGTPQNYFRSLQVSFYDSNK